MEREKKHTNQPMGHKEKTYINKCSTNVEHHNESECTKKNMREQRRKGKKRNASEMNDFLFASAGMGDGNK